RRRHRCGDWRGDRRVDDRAHHRVLPDADAAIRQPAGLAAPLDVVGRRPDACGILMPVRVTLPMLVGSLALLWAVPVHAQEVTNSFQQLSGVIKPGDTIYVTDTGGTRVKGTLTALSASTLQIRLRGDRS